jgi:hypothetical protein
VFLEQLFGLPGRRYLPYPVGNILPLIPKLERRMVGPPRLPVGQYRPITVAADYQIFGEAVVYPPARVLDGLLYLFPSHIFLLLSPPHAPPFQYAKSRTLPQRRHAS